MTRSIVVGVDFSDRSRRALDAATGLARDLGASLVLVHAFTMLPHVAGPRNTNPDPITQVELEVEMEEAVELTAAWANEARKAGLEVETVAVEAAPDEAILDAAKRHHALLVVVGTHGRTGLKRLLLGSVAETVVQQSDRPVLVVP